MKPFSLIAASQEALSNDETFATTEPTPFNANLKSTNQPFDFPQFKPLKSSIALTSQQSQTANLEARLRAIGINPHEDPLAKEH
jgi:hypothetical protein